jgi:hypothetical protein
VGSLRQGVVCRCCLAFSARAAFAVGAAIMAVVLSGAWLSGTAIASSPLIWSAPGEIDHHPPFAAPANFTGVACPTVTVCVGVDGGVVTSSNPSGDYRAWLRPSLPLHAGATTAVSCPSVSLCVAVTSSGDVLTATNATGGPWTAASVDGTRFLTAVSCTGSLCVAVDQQGNVVSSTDPTGGSAAWTSAAVDAPNRLLAVSCPSSTLCVALDSAGNVLSSTNPTGGAGTWSSALVDPFTFAGNTNLFAGISCASTSLCVAVDYAGNILNATNPAGGASAWHTVNVSPGGFASFLPAPAISCPSTSLCAVVVAGIVISSTNPSGAANAWSTASLSDEGFLTGISCPTTSFCAAVDQVGGSPGFPIAFTGGDAVTSTDPTGGSGAWNVQQVAGTNVPDSVSCSEPSFCVVGDDGGNIVTSGDPSGGASTWSFAHIDPSFASGLPGSAVPPTLTSLACQSALACVAGDDSGDVMTSTNAGGGSAAWRFFNAVGEPFFETFNGASCPSASQCFMISTSGNLAEVDPAATSAPVLVAVGDFTAISCPSASLCVAVGSSDAATSTSPTGGPSAWHHTTIDGGNELSGVSCPSSTLCVATDQAGNVLSSTNPAGGVWTVAPVDPGNQLSSVSCASPSLCVATDGTGNVFVSTSPSGGAATWGPTTVDASALTAVSCAASPFCVALDAAGNALVGSPSGTGRAPSVTTGSARHVRSFSAVLVGTVNPNGSTVTACHFEYGTSTRHTGSIPCEHIPGSGTGAVTVSATIRRLMPGKSYYFRLVAVNGAGRASGGDRSFTTPGRWPGLRRRPESKRSRLHHYARTRAQAQARRHL